MVVDDDPSMRLMMSSALESLGLCVKEAEDGIQALTILENMIPDLLLLDVMMPGMDGFEVCARLKKNPLLSEIPIVLVTGNNDIDSIQRAFELGITDFVTKPIPWALIGYRINFLLRATKSFTDLKENQKRLSHAQQLAGMGTWSWDLHTDTIWFSEEVMQIFNYDPHGFDASFQSFISSVHPADRERVLYATSIAIETNTSYSIDHQLMLCDGKTCFVHTEASVISDRHGTPIKLEGAIQDITKRKEAENQISRLAFFDTLTGLPNRTLYQDHLKRIHSRSEIENTQYALLFIDIDEFKTINDTLGHHLGDVLLQQLALRLKESVRSEDFAASGMVARLGGDEFVVIIDTFNSSEDLAIIAQRIISNLRCPVMLEESEVSVTGSIGISIFPDDGTDTATLIKHADIAMYSAKDMGKNTFRYFNQVMHVAATLQLEIEKALKMAINNNEFLMHYQPQVDLLTKKIVAFESLIRWNNPTLGIVAPATFIPLAEKSNFIKELDRWVISKVFGQIRNWLDMGVGGFKVAINLSGKSIVQNDISEFVLQQLEKQFIDPNLIQIEITEGILMLDADAAERTLYKLKNIGVSLAIDDFGTGYSSLQYLHRLPVDTIKIDQSFVSKISDINQKEPLISTIIALAQSMELLIVAEGIEREVQNDYLSINHCHIGQGYLYSYPVPAEQVPLLLVCYNKKASYSNPDSQST